MQEDAGKVQILWTPEWHIVLHDIIAHAEREVFLVCPWLKLSGAELILNALEKNGGRQKLRLRFLSTLALGDFLGTRSASDLEAYMLLLAAGFDVRVVRGLHAKVYVCDDEALVASGNLTAPGLGRAPQSNLEVAVHVESPLHVPAIRSRLSATWNLADRVTPQRVNEMTDHIAELVHLRRAKLAADPVGGETTGAGIAFSAPSTTRKIPRWEVPDETKQSKRLPMQLRVPHLLFALLADPNLGHAAQMIRNLREANRIDELSQIKSNESLLPSPKSATGQPEPNDSCTLHTGVGTLPTDSQPNDGVMPPIAPAPEVPLHDVGDFALSLADSMRMFLRRPLSTSTTECVSHRALNSTFAADQWEPGLGELLPHPLCRIIADSATGTIETTSKASLRAYGGFASVLFALAGENRLRFYESLLALRLPGRAITMLYAAKLLPLLGLKAIDHQLTSEDPRDSADKRVRLTLHALDNAPESPVIRWAVLLRSLGTATAEVFLQKLGVQPAKRALIVSLIRLHGDVKDLFLSHSDHPPLEKLSALVERVGDEWPFHIGMADALFGDILRRWANDKGVLIESECARINAIRHSKAESGLQ